jgi:N-acetylmuramoyl-L-alanine amidase
MVEKVQQKTNAGANTHYLLDSLKQNKSIKNDSIMNIESIKKSILKRKKDIPSPIDRDKLPLSGIMIMVNSGHNCYYGKHHDAGAIAKYKGKTYKEMDLAAKIADDVERKLTLLGADVISVRKKPIKEICATENQINPDMFLAIHLDKNPKGELGKMIFANSDISKLAAKYLNNKRKSNKTIPNFGINKLKKGGVSEEKVLTVLQANPQIAAMLLETGNMAFSSHMKHLTDSKYQDIEAQTIVDGIRDFFGNFKREAEDTKKILFHKKLLAPLRMDTPKLPIQSLNDFNSIHTRKDI